MRVDGYLKKGAGRHTEYGTIVAHLVVNWNQQILFENQNGRTRIFS